MPDKKETITFRVHNGWAMVSELLGDKVSVRAIRFGKIKDRVADEMNGHRSKEIECEGVVKIQPKRYDISSFTATSSVPTLTTI